MATEQVLKLSMPAPRKGLDKSVPEDQLDPLFSPDLNNCETIDGVLQRRRGYTELLTGFPEAEAVMEGFTYGDAAGTLHQVFCTVNKLIEYNSGDTWSDRSGAITMTGNAGNPVFMVNVGALSTDAMFVTNGIDIIKKWTGTGNWANISLTGYTTLLGKCAAGFKGHLVLGNVIEDGTTHVYRLVWSNQGDPEDYSGTTAGFINLIEDAENTKIMTLMPLKLVLIAYKAGSIYNLEYRGGRNGIYFAADMVIANSGAISPKAVAPIGDLDLHFVVTESNVQLFDGFQFVRPAIGDRIKTDLFADINWTWRENVFAKAFPEYYTVVFVYPAGVSTVPNKGYMWNWKEDSWHPFQFNDITYSLTYSDLFFTSRKGLAGTNGNVVEIFTGNNDNTATIDSYWTSKKHDYSELDRIIGTTLHDKRKVAQRQEIDHSGTLPSIELGVCNSILDSPTFATAQTLADDPNGLPRTTIRTANTGGRYHTLKVSDNSTNSPFKTSAYVLHSSLRGGR